MCEFPSSNQSRTSVRRDWRLRRLRILRTAMLEESRRRVGGRGAVVGIEIGAIAMV